jgi:chromosome segregation ATPase
VKYCCSEEITDEINELFKKSSSVHPGMSFSGSQGQKITNCTDINQFTSLAENSDIKLCTLREDFDQTVIRLKDEISELKSDLCVKQAKIQAPESELATFKGNCKSSLENTKAKLESCEIELNKNGKNIEKHERNFQKLSKDLEKLRKETKEIGKVKSISDNN